MAESYLIRGKKLHVELFGKRHSPAVLFLHGGPGESCYEFVYHQAEKLASELFVVAIDQRGVCRSERIGDDEPFGLEDLIEDCEELRQQLGIASWSVIGHSFGGYLALIYAVTYPESVAEVIFECPTFDFGWTAKSLLTKAVALFEKMGDEARSVRCLQLAAGALPAKELFDQYLQLGDDLGEQKELIYSEQEVSTDYTLYTENEWDQFDENTEIHLNRLREEGKIFDSAVPLISRLTVPSLLILGENDPVTCERHVRAYRAAPRGKIKIFEDCGHTPHKERPELYKNVVIDYICSDSDPY
ncbi:proline iminopeptidase [Paenibacillus faecis]|uniref:alpha/beta fold hydrolase n=1 Tax=Paenibacillus faecis TaxID=862114 RepID=UPI001B184E94|nr:alpha/beta hydrolase [Paenibacillus faecis]GIO84883.1 proline iminopeptidase [Paenibacillus faecis]